ncbi:malate dehydrogenase (quinone) [Klebsiella quasipneumoniae]|uniref:Probable malate:quinone oxidoreductase n=1 Tax=Klebsiella quasipneumoniae subsp. quasipneumoniae TaxID=1667327 RepID=A0AAW8XL76_9ENTR|nr:malate dehydrogenase (quinone) [Klebsiella quasipneumoniae]ELT0940762.1 malate dehydrogenase (quinone) [Klebsiella quasipneumoniae]MBM5556025.1 malate dehydrogenase (quinone) [Klebsiella quasipneumoniae]MBM5560712.1 malate dehydrogenase (quinone) [Klebsiella quasipneumoniae]MCJ4448224.1 malate dehydrogenase (quinone) [Klebsiella quasipneumoniae]MDV0841132.1 malate dehydrogenase (quinone) [Klebsiella quasipneumoniae subsp. quasipneumoniae]
MNKKMAVPRSQAVGPNSTRTNTRHEQETDVLLIGGGIMSATLGTWLQELEPDWSITMVEQMSSVAEESSNGWNNAGTGHAALMELNYTPQTANGINIDKAVDINEAFHISRQFWAHQVTRGVLNKPKSFINSVPHMSFVWGEDNVNFLRARYAALQQSELFRGIRYSEDHQQIKAWAPLVMEGRDPLQKVAATRTEVGTDVNYGEITRQLIASLQKHDNFSLQLGTVVRRFKRNADKSWTVTLADADNRRQKRVIKAKFIFIGAGGAALTLLQETGIPQAKEYAGFPVGGQFLVCENPEVVNHHLAKVYGQAEVGAPPMSVPHIDTRIIDGKRVVLFGPFATFSTRFLKNGSLWDLLASTNTSNILPMLNVGLDNFDLVKYLISQVMQKDKDRLAALCEYYPEARKEDWRLWQAGQRVQIIKRDAKKGGVLRLGTEVVSDDEGTVAALLGASPGASTAAPIMLQLMEKVFKDKVNSPEWQARLKAIIPTYGIRLDGNPAEIEKALAWTSEVLELKYEPAAAMDEAPQAELKPLNGGKPIADIAL